MVTLADGQQKKGASREIVPCAGYVRHVTHDEIADAVG